MSSRKIAAVSVVEHPSREDTYLCVWNKRYSGWGLPGGKVEDGESPADGQERELREETGCGTGERHLVYVGEHNIPVAAARGSVVYVYRVEVIGTPREAEEGCPVQWLGEEYFLANSPFVSFYRGVFDFIRHGHDLHGDKERIASARAALYEAKRLIGDAIKTADDGDVTVSMSYGYALNLYDEVLRAIDASDK